MSVVTSLVTYEGKSFDYINPTAEMISIKDIRMSLSRLTRFLGHTHRNYTVGEHTFHCLVMAQKLGFTPREQLLVFVHDFTEAYVGDCPSPLKKLLPEFEHIERRVELAICRHIGISPPTQHEHIKIKKIDMTMLTIEMKQLTNHNWMEFYETDIHKEFVEDEDFDLTDPIGERMIQDLLKDIYAELCKKLVNN